MHRIVSERIRILKSELSFQLSQFQWRFFSVDINYSTGPVIVYRPIQSKRGIKTSVAPGVISVIVSRRRRRSFGFVILSICFVANDFQQACQGQQLANQVQRQVRFAIYICARKTDQRLVLLREFSIITIYHLLGIFLFLIVMFFEHINFIFISQKYDQKDF